MFIVSPWYSGSWRVRFLLWCALRERRKVSLYDFLRTFTFRVAPMWRGDFPKGSTVLLLGDYSRELMGLQEEMIHPLVRFGITWRQIPLPGGRWWYADSIHRVMVGMILEEMYMRAKL